MGHCWTSAKQTERECRNTRASPSSTSSPTGVTPGGSPALCAEVSSSASRGRQKHGGETEGQAGPEPAPADAERKAA